MDAETKNLVERATGGDPDSFEALIRKFGRLVYAQAYAVLRHRQEAEDAAQESFTKAFRALAELRDTETFPSWICSVARHRALDALRKRGSVEEREDREEPADPGGGDPSKELEAAEMRGKIFAALDELPENHRTAVMLRYLEGMDYGGIQEALGISNGSLRGILGRSLQALRKALDPWVRGEPKPATCSSGGRGGR